MVEEPANQNMGGAAKAPPTPKVKGFRIPAVRNGSTDELMRALGTLSFLRISQDSADLSVILALNVEARDISKNPYIFSICYFRADAIDVLYTLTPNKSPRVRRLDILKYVLNLLTLCAGIYEINMKFLYQMIEGAIADMNEYVSMDFQKLFSKYDSLKGEHDMMLKKIQTLENSNRELASDNYEMKNREQELLLKLSSLEKYSDSVLAIKIQDWINEHSGEINLSDFARVHNVSEARVEQVLNTLVSEGYLESRK
ncbi:hypothetical protein COU37_04790 [Candidatus Micrarchaeota archaeon CG10_big_fil_rev_8_21_14_0_10_45_29]|nr:MAG: hypothetical protein COU37_04790 [Candidatus Micrarchaeota archaeon CG10_big_fil_rev_8_21_14_0_10_45_29]